MGLGMKAPYRVEGLGRDRRNYHNQIIVKRSMEMGLWLQRRRCEFIQFEQQGMLISTRDTEQFSFGWHSPFYSDT